MNTGRLKRIMDKKKIGQRELSRKSGLSVSIISYAYNGTRTGQTGETVRAIEKALRLKKGELL